MAQRPFLLTALLAAAATAAPALAAETVAVPGFRSVQLRGGGNVVLRRGPTQRVTLVEGSTAHTKFHVTPDGEFRINACKGRCPLRYKLSIEIQSPSVPGVAVSKGGRIVADGSFPAQGAISAAVNGGGQIDTRTVAARQVSATLNGGGQILVWAEESLFAAVNGGGTVGYRGRPAVSTAINNGGIVSQTR